MIFTDTHAHIYAEDFLQDYEECYHRSIQQGVSRVFVPNIDLSSISVLKSICNQFSDTYFPMMGLHPCSVKQDYETVLTQIYDELVSSKYYAVGEIGIDLYWDKSTYQIQKNAFIEQAQWAIKYDLPVAIHSRDSTKELISIIKTEKLTELRGIFHCFTGDVSEAKELLLMGFYLGIGGVVTYKNSTLPQTLLEVGFEKLVLETDAPYLPPVPYRGKRNEPSYVPLVAQKLSQLFNLPIAEIAEITTNNSAKIFAR